MLETFGDDPQRQRLDLCDGIVAVSAVAQDAGQSGHLSDPAPVDFALQFNGEGHGSNLPPDLALQQALAPAAAGGHGPKRVELSGLALPLVRGHELRLASSHRANPPP